MHMPQHEYIYNIAYHISLFGRKSWGQIYRYAGKEAPWPWMHPTQKRVCITKSHSHRSLWKTLEACALGAHASCGAAAVDTDARVHALVGDPLDIRVGLRLHASVR